MKKYSSYIIIGIITIFLIAITIFGAISPETYIYNGVDVPKKFLKEIKELELLEDDEVITYFYSDAFFDIKKGFYLVTDRHLIAYSSEWEEPKTIIPFEDIYDVVLNRNESLLEDSMLYVEAAEYTLDFPLSSEKGRDKDFYNYLLLQSGLEEDAIE